MSSVVSSPAPTGRVYLNCPFDEKDQAKAKGREVGMAKSRKWFVPAGCRNLCDFNQWLGRTYINCPFAEKDQAKAKGARFDGAVKCWYIPDGSNTSLFSRWLPASSSLAIRKTSSPAKKKNPSKKGKTGSASLPRINSDMTVSQLVVECKVRDPSITGLSGKNKAWLLDHLGPGTVWISADSSSSTSKKTADATPMSVKKSTNDKKRAADSASKSTKKLKIEPTKEGRSVRKHHRNGQGRKAYHPREETIRCWYKSISCRKAKTGHRQWEIIQSATCRRRVSSTYHAFVDRGAIES